MEATILRLLHDTSWLIGAVARGTPGGIIIAAQRVKYHVEKLEQDARAAERELIRQEQLELQMDEESIQ